MKTHHINPKSKTRTALLSLALGVALLGSASAARADDMIVATFDTDISALGFQNWRSYVTGGTVAWDGSRTPMETPAADPLHHGGLAADRLGHWLERCAVFL